MPPGAHHRLIAHEIEQLLVSTEYDTLLIFAPPGSAKSSYVSVALPSWYLARFPKNNVLAASHSITLAERFGRRVRNLVSEHSRTLNVAIAGDNAAAARWATAQGGEYYAAGVGTGIAGFRADLGIIDDPIASREQAYSKLIRDKIWDWYIQDFSSRLKPGAKRIIMHTRWHVDDLAGRVMAQAKEKGIKIRILSLPAVATAENDPLGRRPGEWLWDDPSGYNYGAFLKARKAETTDADWASLYQQNPVIDGGNIIKLEYWRDYKPPDGKWPTPLFTLASFDGAYTEKTHNDPSALTVWRIYKGPDNRPKVVLCAAWQRWLPLHGPDCASLPNETLAAWATRTSHQWGVCEWISYTCDKLNVDRLLIEAKATGLTVAQELRRLHANKRWTVLTVDPSGMAGGQSGIKAPADKVGRAHSVQSIFVQGLVHAPFDKPWAELVRQECAAFPAGQRDDLVDTTTQALAHLREIGILQRTEEYDEVETALARKSMRPIEPLYPS